MNRKQSVQLAEQLLDSEFESFNFLPAAYCISLGWSEELILKGMLKKDKLSPSYGDIQNLASIIESCGTNDTIEIAEHNSVSDFLCNCVASHIIA